MPKALGLIETRGLVAAIEAADAMVKTSNVTLVGKEIVKPALVTIKIVGEVAAVKAAVDAGAAAARKVGVVVSIHVIPQPDSQMESILPEIRDDEVKKLKPVKTPEPPSEKPPDDENKKYGQISIDAKKDGIKPEIKTKVEIKKETVQEKETDNLFSTSDHLNRLRKEALGIKSAKAEPEISEPIPSVTLSLAELENLNVHQLRKQARAMADFPIQGREISKANRRVLLDYFKKII